jgi:hypothetical protein
MKSGRNLDPGGDQIFQQLQPPSSSTCIVEGIDGRGFHAPVGLNLLRLDLVVAVGLRRRHG